MKLCPLLLVCGKENPILGFTHTIYAPAWNADAAVAEQIGQAAMTVAFVMTTSNLDLALTKVAEGQPVSYCGRHQGVFRFESVKAATLRRFHASPLRGALGLPEGQEAAFRRFLAGA